MDRRLAQPREPGEQAERHASPLDRLQSEGDAECGEDTRPREVRKGQHGVEGAELGHPQVQTLGRVAKDHRMPQRPDHQTQAESERHEEEREDARRPVLDEVADEDPSARHQGKRASHPGQMKHENQGHVRDRRQVAEDDPEHEQVGRRARLGRVPVLPRPQSLPPLAHFGQVCRGVVPEVEKADEDMARGLAGVCVDVRDRGDHGEDESHDQGEAPLGEPLSPVGPPLRSFQRHLPTWWGGDFFNCFHLAKLNRSTVHRARPISPWETLEAPATRSSKRIGTSTTG